MKNKKRKLGKLSFKKSTIADFGSNSLKGGTGTSWNGCQSWPGEPCFTDFGTDCGTGGGGTGGGGTGGGGNQTALCNYTDNCQSHSICPRGVQCY